MGIFEKIAALINGSDTPEPKPESEPKKEQKEDKAPVVEDDVMENNPEEDSAEVEETWEVESEVEEEEAETEEFESEEVEEDAGDEEELEIASNPKPSPAPKRELAADDSLPGSNGIEKKDNLILAVIQKLEANYRGEEHSMAGKSLVVCISEPFFRDSVNNDDFKEELEAKLADELGLHFDKIVIEGAPSKGERDIVRLYSDVSMGIRAARQERAVRSAVVTPLPGFGMTLEEEYRLDSETVMAMPNRQCNIGAGRYPQMPGHAFRENHIAIDDNPSSSDYEKNKYVSRAHACITYSEKNGFMLRVEQSGSRMAGKRTHIMRGTEMIELTNPFLAVPLRDGDHIVLSKVVHLLFNEA